MIVIEAYFHFPCTKTLAGKKREKKKKKKCSEDVG